MLFCYFDKCLRDAAVKCTESIIYQIIISVYINVTLITVQNIDTGVDSHGHRHQKMAWVEKQLDTVSLQVADNY